MEAPVFQKIKKPVVGLITMLTLALASLIGFASTASASEVEQVQSSVSITVESRTVAGKVTLAVRAHNTGSNAVDINLVTPYGSKSFANVASDKSAYQAFATRQTSIDPASVKVVVDDVSVSVNHVSSVTSVDFTAASRSFDGTPALAVRAHNTGSNAVDIDLVTPYGSKSFSSVAVDSNAYQTFVVRAS